MICVRFSKDVFFFSLGLIWREGWWFEVTFQSNAELTSGSLSSSHGFQGLYAMNCNDIGFDQRHGWRHGVWSSFDRGGRPKLSCGDVPGCWSLRNGFFSCGILMRCPLIRSCLDHGIVFRGYPLTVTHFRWHWRTCQVVRLWPFHFLLLFFGVLAPVLFSQLQTWWSRWPPIIPHSWKDGWLTMIPKVGKSPSKYEHLRPIALQEPLGKAVIGILTTLEWPQCYDQQTLMNWKGVHVKSSGSSTFNWCLQPLPMARLGAAEDGDSWRNLSRTLCAVLCAVQVYPQLRRRFPWYVVVADHSFIGSAYEPRTTYGFGMVSFGVIVCHVLWSRWLLSSTLEPQMIFGLGNQVCIFVSVFLWGGCFQGCHPMQDKDPGILPPVYQRRQPLRPVVTC